MSEPVAKNELVRLAEASGAVFRQSSTGTWTAHRNDTPGVWGMSQVDAAARFLEEIGVEPAEPAAILAAIKFQFRPYDTRLEFAEGLADQQAGRPHREYDGVAGQAYDRGYSTGIQYGRALSKMGRC
jgi:hypothetical protein